MISRKKPGDTDDLLTHILEDVFVGADRAEHGRSVRMVTHADSDLVELVSCDEEAVRLAKERLMTGRYTVRGSILRRPDDLELAVLMSRHRVPAMVGDLMNKLPERKGHAMVKGKTAKAKFELAMNRADNRPEGNIMAMLYKTRCTPKERQQVETIMLRAALRPEDGERER